MPSITVDVQVWCAKCGAGLCNQSTTHTSRGQDLGVNVEPCQTCLDAAADKAVEQARQEWEEEHAES